jgi:hypothetical protein
MDYSTLFSAVVLQPAATVPDIIWQISQRVPPRFGGASPDEVGSPIWTMALKQVQLQLQPALQALQVAFLHTGIHASQSSQSH